MALISSHLSKSNFPYSKIPQSEKILHMFLPRRTKDCSTALNE
uniref:Uncharacterized protein n=1 Tax=Brassica campestris TaxID=3711 RepID=A0A3P6C2U5_BRACM|nr:unnamed protein product [Brassica rapa]